jgi:hypothetical protein
MSTLACLILYRRDRLVPAILVDALAGAEPVDAHERLQRFHVSEQVEGIVYEPPQRPTRWERWDYGREWFDEELSQKLARLLWGADGESREVVLYAHDDANGSFWVWQIGRDIEELRWLSDGTGCRSFRDDDGEWREEVESTRASSEAEQRSLEEPLSAEPVLRRALGLSSSEILSSLPGRGEGEQLWPSTAVGASVAARSAPASARADIEGMEGPCSTFPLSSEPGDQELLDDLADQIEGLGPDAGGPYELQDHQETEEGTFLEIWHGPGRAKLVVEDDPREGTRRLHIYNLPRELQDRLLATLSLDIALED